MAGFYFNGVDALEADLMQLAQFSDDDKWNIIQPGAEVFKLAHQEKIRASFTQRTGVLAKSITVKRKVKDGNVVAVISPAGKHPGTGTGKRMKKENGKRRSSGRYYGSNAEVLYYLEYGTPRIPASHVIEKANEEAEPEVMAAEAAAWDQYLSSKGF